MTVPSSMRAWRVHQYGEPLDVLQLQTVDTPEPGPGQLLVQAEGIPLNLNDLERINGGNMMVRPEFPYAPGMEAMGKVVAAGEGAESWVGKRVAAVADGAHGGFAEFVKCPALSAFEVPQDLPMPDAAALFFPFHLAWLGLYDRARLQAGETVLIHAAAGGSGSAAIQLAKHIGATVIASAGSEEKLQFCRELGADYAVNYKEADFCELALQVTDGKGVDVVFDNVGEAVIERSMNALAYNGRYAMMGFASNKSVADEPFLVPRKLALGNFSMLGVMLSYMDDSMITGLKSAMGWNFPPRALGEEIQSSLMKLYRNGAIKAVVGKAISFEEIPQAIADMAASKTMGRVVAVL